MGVLVRVVVAPCREVAGTSRIGGERMARRNTGPVKQAETGVEMYTTKEGKQIWRIKSGRASVLTDDYGLWNIVDEGKEQLNRKRNN